MIKMVISIITSKVKIPAFSKRKRLYKCEDAIHFHLNCHVHKSNVQLNNKFV